MPAIDPGLAEDRQLLFALQIVADVAVENAAPLMTGVRIFHQDRDCHRRTGALAEDLAAFLP